MKIALIVGPNSRGTESIILEKYPNAVLYKFQNLDMLQNITYSMREHEFQSSVFDCCVFINRPITSVRDVHLHYPQSNTVYLTREHHNTANQFYYCNTLTFLRMAQFKRFIDRGYFTGFFIHFKIYDNEQKLFHFFLRKMGIQAYLDHGFI